MKAIEKKTVDAIRILSAEGVQRANSGHPGLPMGSAPLAYALWTKHLKHNPQNPAFADRDRFVLSAGMAPCCCIRFYICPVIPLQ